MWSSASSLSKCWRYFYLANACQNIQLPRLLIYISWFVSGHQMSNEKTHCYADFCFLFPHVYWCLIFFEGGCKYFGTHPLSSSFSFSFRLPPRRGWRYLLKMLWTVTCRVQLDEGLTWGSQELGGRSSWKSWEWRLLYLPSLEKLCYSHIPWMRRRCFAFLPFLCSDYHM